MNDINIICFHGKPCAGKDTQANKLISTFNDSIKISTGEIFRGAKSKKGDFAKYYLALEKDIEVVNAGGLIRDEVITPIVGEVIENNISEGKRTFLFTGFPRTSPQVKEFNKMLPNLNSNLIKEKHIFLDISDETAIKRSEIRKEGAIFNNQKTRTEDETNAFLKRLEDFKGLTLPMIKQIKKSGKLITIDGEKTIDEVSFETLASLGLIQTSKERR
ncbi:nucleoside monophosphate kinase [Patescibacteria group bacterium]|nr:nucleoside monophosphate kinase [Patescibacteria group bacterium]MBU2036097.1 nucleoside monophosphate kinase [Patescibacteria group bacterium]